MASSRVGPDDASLFLGLPHQGPQRVPLVRTFHHLNVPRCRAWSCLLLADWKNFESISSNSTANGFNHSMVSSVSFSALTRFPRSELYDLP